LHVVIALHPFFSFFLFEFTEYHRKKFSAQTTK
jgi:hypothetical protein